MSIVLVLAMVLASAGLFTPRAEAAGSCWVGASCLFKNADYTSDQYNYYGSDYNHSNEDFNLFQSVNDNATSVKCQFTSGDSLHYTNAGYTGYGFLLLKGTGISDLNSTFDDKLSSLKWLAS